MARKHILKERSRKLRRNSTDAEKKLWPHLRNRQLGGAKFRRQVELGPYIVDLVCLEARLIVELDGGQHTVETDAKRTAFLERQGFRVIRFWNNDVLLNMEGVLIRIEEALSS